MNNDINKAAEEGALDWPHAPGRDGAQDAPPNPNRASRQVANKAEVEPVAYLHDVVWEPDGEPDQALSFAPDNFPLANTLGFRSVGYKPLYATPPATTGASTANIREILESIVQDGYLSETKAHRARRALDESVGASTVLTDERIEAIWSREAGQAEAGKRRIAFARAIAREIAAQAGQVAVPGWISVDEREPEEGVEVWIAGDRWDGEGVYQALAVRCNGDYLECHGGDDEGTYISVTHWQPLPDAPAKEYK